MSDLNLYSAHHHGGGRDDHAEEGADEEHHGGDDESGVPVDEAAKAAVGALHEGDGALDGEGAVDDALEVLDHLGGVFVALVGVFAQPARDEVSGLGGEAEGVLCLALVGDL